MVEEKKFENVLVSVEDEIALVTINRPKALNALNSATLKELKEIVEEIETRKDIKVVIVTGSGEKSFVAGADISEMVSATPVQGKVMAAYAHYVFTKLENIPQVVIAAVNGFALGGGCEFAMSADFRYASENAKFGQPEVNLGVIPGWGGTQRLPRLIGKGRAKELIYTADLINAEEAYRIGLVNKVVPLADLISTAKATAKKIISKGSYAVTLAKNCVNTGLDVDLASGSKYELEAFSLLFSTDDKKEGMGAFLEKRPAKLTDF
ncbi:MAG: enoyl-CoA hydratase/isomerase family protein [Fusobacteriaceae bacterium]|jgi:enoyl-CoA hydratase|nr:enoyl-CoA hydratase/isomerase family protein [Fusobacteriaceae bacterium]